MIGRYLLNSGGSTTRFGSLYSRLASELIAIDAKASEVKWRSGDGRRDDRSMQQ
jgi:hypothetical protein